MKSIRVKKAGVAVSGSTAKDEDAGTITFTAAAQLSEGTYAIEVTAEDNAGNGTASSTSFTVDATSPTISDLSPADGST
ncbi:unnamed protein product, partial [marine sediment metagenome]